MEKLQNIENYLIIPKTKEKLVNDTKKLIEDYEKQYQDGFITRGEKYNKVVDVWSKCTDSVANEMMKEISSAEKKSKDDVSKRLEKDSLSGDKFFENKINEKEGKFIDVSESSGIYSSPLGYGLAITTADINNDGWIDLYVGNDFHENDYIYII